MEVFSSGAEPICVVDNLTSDLDQTGLEILRGVKEEAVQAGLNPRSAVTGSYEKNFVVEQTGVGVTVIGICDKKDLRIGVSKAGDALVALGTPSVGAEVLAAEEQGVNCTIDDVLKLLSVNFVHEVIPVGSGGINCEVEVLAKSSGLKFISGSNCRIDFDKSAGPATVILASLAMSQLACLQSLVQKPISLLGNFK